MKSSKERMSIVGVSRILDPLSIVLDSGQHLHCTVLILDSRFWGDTYLGGEFREFEGGG